MRCRDFAIACSFTGDAFSGSGALGAGHFLPHGGTHFTRSRSANSFVDLNDIMQGELEQYPS